MADAGDMLWTIIGIGIVGGGLYLAYKNKDKLAGILGGLKKGGGFKLPLPALSGPKTNTSNGSQVVTRPGGAAIKFAAAGDWESGRHNVWKNTVANIKKLSPSVILFPGDFSYSGGPGKWAPVTNALKGARLVGARGNHDTNGDYGKTFNNYSNGVVTIGDTSIMSLDTETGSSTVSWARANLKKMAGRWKIVQFHKPIYRSSAAHGYDEGHIGALIPDFARAKINLVIAGHSHNYERFAPKNGVTYTVVGTGGAHFHGFKGKTAGSVKQIKNQFGCLLCTTGLSMSCRFVSNSGKVLDSWTMR